MKNILKNIIAGGLMISALAACDMNLKPTTQIVYDENAPLFLTETDVTQFQNGVWASYRELQYGVFTQTPEVMCDGFNATASFGNNYGPVHRTDESYTTSNSYTESVWSNNYWAIKNYNIVIRGAQNDVPEELKEAVSFLKGFAHYCRAASYLTLARYYGPAYNPATADIDPCVPKVVKYDQLAKPTRAKVQEIYDLIFDDLTEAATLLEDVPGQVRSPYPTIDAVKALWARYYLDTKDYENAAYYAMDVIKSPAGYELSSTPQMMENEFTKDNGTEPIVQMFASKAEGLAYNNIYTNVMKDNDGKYFNAYFLPSQKLVNAYDPGDLRNTAWFSNSMYPVFISGTKHEGVTVFTKYLGNPTLTDGDVETGAHAAKPLTISEMYLIAAEAYAQLPGKAMDAEVVLNALQEARNATPTSATLENIKNEWFRETVGEGHRFICLKRWGDGFEGRPAQNSKLITSGKAYEQKALEPGSYLFNWPIPAYELKLNDLDQNLGYN